MFSFNLKPPSEHSTLKTNDHSAITVLSWGGGRKLHVCGSKLKAAHVPSEQVVLFCYTCFYFPAKDNTHTHTSLSGPVSFVSQWNERSQPNFQTGRNVLVERAWSRRPPERRERLDNHCQSKWLTATENVLWKVNSALRTLPLNASPQTFTHFSQGCSKCIIIKTQPVVGLHCKF